MGESDRIIPLDFKRKDFEEIYFRNKQSNIFLSAIVRRELFTFLIFLFALFCTIIYSLLTDKSAWLILLFLIFSAFTFIPYYIKALQILRWRINVIEFLKKNEKFKSQRLVINKESISLIQDNTENIHKWSAFTNIEITESYLIMTGTAQYIFPKKSMQAEDYEYLVHSIKTHVKNGI